ncbi:MAG TPA: TonB-dependent receptor [Pyrinomonadaceae bacterium]|nr:TonB-dependent receptor [Pyrinomonadaceae bacterium]
MSRLLRGLLVLAALMGATTRVCAQPQQTTTARVRGLVLDTTGAPVRRAEVALSVGAEVVRRATTGDDGRFAFEDVQATRGSVAAHAAGFARREERWTLSDADGQVAEIRLVLAPEGLAEQVTVTATRTDTKLGETAASLRVISRETLETTASQTLDDALRQVPGFQLFRRTGSRAANPTAQGVSLRGVGASGASRALVLADGVPLNDPFGGWVSWGRVPRESVARVEVLRGGASDLYGSAALGGVVQILTRRAEERPTLSFEASYGSQRTHDASLFAAARSGRWGATLAAESFHTGGYFLIRREERGAADTPAAARYTALTATLEREMSDHVSLFARASYFGEARDNGTLLQRNRTHLRQLVAGSDWRDTRAGTFVLRGYAGAQVFDQSFSAVSEDRESETLTRDQRVPAQSVGVSLQWSRAFGHSHAVVAGFDAREVRGASDEIVFAQGRATSKVGAGGRERMAGVFAEHVWRLSAKWLVTTAARFDRWRNFDASSANTPLGRAGSTVVNIFPDRSETAFSPRASLLYSAHARLSLYASAYRAFRAPTLNELYRAFRVGDVLTLANENLRAERLTGAEGGAAYTSARRRLTARATFFYLTVTRPVANVTLTETPTLITRQRQNLGRLRSRGFEFEAEALLRERWSLSGGYLLTDSVVARFPANVALEGARVPQVPRHILSFRLDYRAPSRLTVGLQGRASSTQFDDDLNRFPLAPFFTLDALASRPLNDQLELFAAGENLTGRRYEVGRTPIETLGPPLSVRVGMRIRLGAR